MWTPLTPLTPLTLLTLLNLLTLLTLLTLGQIKGGRVGERGPYGGCVRGQHRRYAGTLDGTYLPYLTHSIWCLVLLICMTLCCSVQHCDVFMEGAFVVNIGDMLAHWTAPNHSRDHHNTSQHTNLRAHSYISTHICV
jgi:hypothetical protein